MSRRGVGRKRYSIIINTGEKNLQANHVKLYNPGLSALVSGLKEALSKVFETVEVKVTDCPNLAEWGDLAEKGMSGNTRIADVGGEPYMFSPHMCRTTFQLPDIVRACGMTGPALVFGAGAASSKVIGKNGELVVNSLIPGPRHTQYAKIDRPVSDTNSEDDEETELSVEKQEPEPDGYVEPKPTASERRPSATSPTPSDPASPNDAMSPREYGKEEKTEESELSESMVPIVGHYPSEETGCLATLFISDGKPGPVLYIKASKRIGKPNFTNTIREGLKKCKDVGGDKQIGLGGVFRLNKGKVKGHIMPCFPPDTCKLGDMDAIFSWLRFYDFGPELVMFSVMVTDDPTPDKRLHLRLEHTHFYSTAKNVHEAGHYHHDVTPDEVEYEGYFNIAEYIYRVEDAFYNIESSKQ